VIDNLVDLAFFVDLILMFFASYRNNKGMEIKDPKKILVHYLSSRRFVSDFGSLIGQFMSVVRPGSILSYLSILKMTRVLRVSEVIKESNMNKFYKALMNFTKLFFYMVILLHSIGCFWYMTISKSKDRYEDIGQGEKRSLQWYAPTEWMDYSKSKLFTDEITPVEKYWIMFYHGVLFLGLNEMGPVNTNEMQFCIIVLVTCAILESLLFSEMAEIVTNMNMKTN
jgi:hypothetical protein